VIDLRDRYRGALLGLAVGDAVGTTVEFMPPGSFPPVTDMVGGGPFRLQPGQWTDDTSMALCLAESLIENKGFDAGDQMERYLRWYREGYLSSTGYCFDIGNTVLNALYAFEQDPARNPYAGSEDPLTAGNGSLMRLAPVPLFYGIDPAEALRRAADSSRTTHGARTAVDACRYMAALIVGALAGASREELLEAPFTPARWDWSAEPLAPEIEEIAQGSFRRKEPPGIRGTGYVVQSLEAALWAFHRSSDFREGCLLAVNLGDDADTTAAVYGQLAGAFYGVSGIPAEWLNRLALREQIESMADAVPARAQHGNDISRAEGE
jgi:ADP-ribosylglycohydrolase